MLTQSTQQNVTQTEKNVSPVVDIPINELQNVFSSLVNEYSIL